MNQERMKAYYEGRKLPESDLILALSVITEFDIFLQGSGSKLVKPMKHL